MPALVLLMLHIFGAMSLLSGDGGPGAGDSSKGDGQSNGAGGAGDDGDDDGDDADDKADPTKALEALRKERRERRSLAKQVKELLGFKQTVEEERRKVDEKKAKDQGEWQKLAEEREREATTLREQIAQRDREALRSKVAAKHQLPPELAEVLAGDDEAALEAHAAKLAKVVTKPKPIETDAGKRPGGETKGGDGKQQRPYRFQQPNEVKW